MPTTTHMASVADDERHVPGPGAQPLWNESFWFTAYDPQAEIAVVFRTGAHPLQGQANLYLYVAHHGRIVHAIVDHALPLSPPAPRRLSCPNGLDVEWEPRERFALRYRSGGAGFDLAWQGVSPTYLYPHPPDVPAEVVPRHIEHTGTVTGTVTIAGTSHRFDGLGHRDHSWGGERDWSKMHRWEYLNGEFGRDLWFHAVRVKLADLDWIHLGCLWDGAALHTLDAIRIASRTADGGTRQLAVECDACDEQGRVWRFVGEKVLVNWPVAFGRTWLKDGITRYRCGDRVGYGIYELGFVEGLTEPG
jgi:hypothetical protein